MMTRRQTTCEPGAGLWGLFASAALATMVLASCGTKHSALRYSPADPRLHHYGEVATSEEMRGSAARIYDTGPKIEAKMLELIESATDYILIASFLVAQDPETMRVMEALERKRREGVRIYVLADSSSRYAKHGESPYTYLKKRGIPSAEYNPMRVYKLLVAPVMIPRDHRKFWVVDGRILFLGGANIYPTSLRAPEKGGNIDFMAAVESRGAVSAMVESFVATWNESSKLRLRKEAFRIRARPLREGQLWLADQNKDVGREDVIGKMFEGLFAVARKEIWLIQPYTFTNPDMIGQFRELVARGVEVNIMLSEEVHAAQFHYASSYGIKDILETGAKVWTIRRGYGALHAKAILVDGRWASVGSANFNVRSYHLSKEANLVFGDRTSVRRVQRSIDELKQYCRPIGKEEAERYRSPEYFLIWLAMQIMG